MNALIGLVLGVFAAVMLLLLSLYSFWVTRYSAESRRVSARLELVASSVAAGDRPNLERQQEVAHLSTLQALLARLEPGRLLIRLVDQAGGRLMAADLLGLSLAMAACGFLLPSMFRLPAMLGPSLALVLFVMPWWRMLTARTKRLNRLEEQFPEALDLMVRSLRAGQALPSAIRLCGDEMPAPLGPEFRLLADETNYGVAVASALQGLAERVPVPDIRYFVVAVVIQRESGGNMSELLNNISQIVRQRLKLRGQIKTLSAEGRLSGWIMGLLPFGVGLILNLVNPRFMDPLWHDPLGQTLVGGALFLMVVGAIWMRQIVQIRA